jgi:hypothetical protein
MSPKLWSMCRWKRLLRVRLILRDFGGTHSEPKRKLALHWNIRFREIGVEVREIKYGLMKKVYKIRILIVRIGEIVF